MFQGFKYDIMNEIGGQREGITRGVEEGGENIEANLRRFQVFVYGCYIYLLPQVCKLLAMDLHGLMRMCIAGVRKQKTPPFKCFRMEGSQIIFQG